MISIAKPDLFQEEIAVATEVLNSGMLVQSENVAAFEDEALRFLSEKHYAVAVSSGTAALHLALCALDIKPGDKVIVPAFSWPATSNVVELLDATPVFADIERSTMGINGKSLERAVIAAGNNVKAIMVVHAFGCPADMDGILKVAGDIPVVEDAACAIGSKWRDKFAGTLGKIGCFSFHPRKIITTGEGGLVTCAESALIRKIKALRNHGLDPDSDSIDFILPGFNYRMTDFQGAIGVEQLKRLPKLLEYRRKLAGIYDSLLENSPIEVMRPYSHSIANRQTYVVLLPDGCDRDAVICRMSKKGISTTIGTCHIPLTRYYREKYGYQEGDYPVCDVVFHHALTLPLHSGVREEQVTEIVESLLSSI